MLRKAFCGFDAHVAKSDYSLWGLRPPNPRGFFDRLHAGSNAAGIGGLLKDLGVDQTKPWAIMASATFLKPARLAPATRL